jgi:hypothetical protein
VFLTQYFECPLDINFLTGTVPSEVGKATSLKYLIISENPLEGTIPSELGKLEELINLGMNNNQLNGAIPSSLGQLNKLTNLELNNNVLTGSVPVGIVQNKTYVNFNVYGNQLSDLTPVDEWDICTGISNSTGEEGEHYCNCGSDCLADFGQRCQCEEAQACCDTYIEQNGITNCILCEAGFSNPEFLVAPWDFTSCADGATRIYGTLDEFGTEKTCNLAKMESYKRGCVCPDYIPPGKPPGNPPGNSQDFVPQENPTSTGMLPKEEDDMQI